MTEDGFFFFPKTKQKLCCTTLARLSPGTVAQIRSREPDDAAQKRCSLVVLYAMTSLIAAAENQRSLSKGAHPRHEVSRMDSRYNPVTLAVA